MKARENPAGEGSPLKWVGSSGREVFPMCEPLWMFPRRERERFPLRSGQETQAGAKDGLGSNWLIERMRR